MSVCVWVRASDIVEGTATVPASYIPNLCTLVVLVEPPPLPKAPIGRSPHTHAYTYARPVERENLHRAHGTFLLWTSHGPSTTYTAAGHTRLSRR